ncbi:MAG: DUF488 family protein [Planctomycetota bacterium]|jgi:hypothetical protein
MCRDKDDLLRLCYIKIYKLKTPRVGLEPTSQNQQTTTNKRLTENNKPVLSAGLDKIVQKYPELEKIIVAWLTLSGHNRQAIKTLTESCKMKQDEIDKPIVYNMGYQFRTLEDMLKIIKEYGITVLVDVRSIPFSRKKDFNKNNLLQSLPCRYIWRGESLGGKEGERVSDWKNGLVEIANLARTEKVMLMCMEDDVNRCHRRVLAELLALDYNILNVSV